jgi:hypothetical protein
VSRAHLASQNTHIYRAIKQEDCRATSDGVLLPVQLQQHGGEGEEASAEAGARQGPDREETEQPRGAEQRCWRRDAKQLQEGERATSDKKKIVSLGASCVYRCGVSIVQTGAYGVRVKAILYQLLLSMQAGLVRSCMIRPMYRSSL